MSYSFVSEPPQNYVCQVCMNVLQEPHLTECCGQHFCKGCLESWFERNQGRKVCPHCREVDFVHIVSKPLKRKINELKVFCSNRDKGCKDTLNLEELKSHLLHTSGCGYVSIPCWNECSQSVFRGEMDLHLKRCTKRIETCTHCKAEMTYDLLNVHYLLCNEMKVFCHRCGRVLRRCDLKDHEDACPNMPVRCPFYDAGCKKDLTRKELDEHVEKNSSSHQIKVMASISTLKKEFVDFKSQAAVEVARMKNVINKPTAILKSLECMESLLNSYRLDGGLDTISFSIPSKVDYRSHSFIIYPGYTFLVNFHYSRNIKAHGSPASWGNLQDIPSPPDICVHVLLTIDLVLLQGETNDDLQWPMRIDDKTINIYLINSEAPKDHIVAQMTVDTSTLDIQRCVGDKMVVSAQTFDVSQLSPNTLSISWKKC